MPGLAETSGLAASRKNPGVLWAHNDSGDAARVFALTPQGKPLGAYRLAGAAAVDWEDMAIGPVPGRNGDFLYLGDIGNNNGAKRQTVRIYRVAEPKVSANQEPGSYDLTGWEAIDLRYPAEPSDAEALLVDPRSGDLFIVTKNFNGPSYVFHAPAVGRPGGVVPLTALGPVHFGVRGTPIITGGSVLETGEAILLRAYTEILLWHRSDGASLGETLTKTAPCLVPAPLELQGEAVAFAPGGRGYYTIAEGRRAMVHFVAHR